MALNPDTPPAYSVTKLAERWDCTPGAIRKMIRAGKLKAFAIGAGGSCSHYRVSAAEVDRIERCQESQPEPNQDDTVGDGAPSGEITADDLFASLRRLRQEHRYRPVRPKGTESAGET